MVIAAPNEVTCALVHQALHTSFVKEVTINGVSYPIETYKNGCRYVDYSNIRFMTQNKAKSSIYAKKANEGMQITWGQRPGSWIYMESGILDTSVTVYMDGPSFKV